MTNRLSLPGLSRFLSVCVMCCLITAWGQAANGQGRPPTLDAEHLAALQAQYPELDPGALPPGGTPAPAPLVRLPAGVRTLLLLGADGPEPGMPAQDERFAPRTDSLLLVFYHPHGRLSLVSLPRDLYLYQPGFGMATLKWSYSLGGWALLSATISYNLGVHPEEWVLVDFNSFIRFVDEVGGLDLDVPAPLADCGNIPAGMVHLDGTAALCYVRSRFTTSDFDRSLRQRQVLAALLEQVREQDLLADLAGWYRRYRDALRSSLTLVDLAGLATWSWQFPQRGEVNASGISLESATPWRVPQTGAEVLLPELETIRAQLQAAADYAAPRAQGAVEIGTEDD